MINPIAGDIDKTELEEEVKLICRQNDIEHVIYKTTGKSDKEKIEELIRESGFDAVFAAGGDGTVSIVASLLIGTATPLGIVPLGSGNGLSKDLGIPQDPAEALRLVHNGVVRSIDTLDVNGHPSIHLSDLGFNALVVQRFCEGERRGPGAYARIAMQEYLGYKAKHYRIETDQETFLGEAFMVTVANANAYGSNASINPEGVINDGRFEICLIEPFPKAAGISLLLRLYNDTIDQSVYTSRLSCKTATIYNLDHEVGHVDGEPVDLGPVVKVEMRPRSLQVFLPLPGEDL